MVVHTTRSGQVNLGSVNIKKENPDKNGWIQKSIKDIPVLEANLNDEVKAIAQYQEHIENTDDPKTAALLDHIKGEEEGHAKELREAIESNKEFNETFEVEKAGKPYSQQMGRQHGKGAGHIKTPAEKLLDAQDEHRWIPSNSEAANMQKWIDSGTVWHLEGSIGRAAMDMINNGQCILGEKGHKDAYGNYVPSRYEVDPGTKGSIEYAQKMQDEFMEKSIGKPYSQQPGRQHGKGPGHIVGHPGREDEPMIPQDLDEEMKQAIERDVDVNKRFKVQYNIGTAKYVISFHDGVKKHSDGSDFYDIKIFHNKKELEQAINDLRGKGYKEVGALSDMVANTAPFAETGGVLDTSKVADVEMEDIDPHDYPDFSDAFISDASYQMADGTYRQMTDKELEILNEDSDFVYNSIPDDVMSGGE